MSIAGAAKVILFRGLQQALLQSIMGATYDPEFDPEPIAMPDPAPAMSQGFETANQKIATKFRELADAMQKEIDSKYDSGVSKQRYTARRASIAASMAADGARLEGIQAAMRWLADQWEMGITPRALLGVRSKKAVEQVLHGYYTDNSKASHGITNAGDFETAKMHLKMGASQKPKPVDPQREIRELENALRGRKIDGFFPTPRSVWDELQQIMTFEDAQRATVRKLFAWINDHDDCFLKVIDPSAGIGSLLDYLKADFNLLSQKWRFYACEVNHDCRKVLDAKGYKAPIDPRGEFVTDSQTLKSSDDQYDIVLMNPPFENRADAKHVMHAYEHLLKPGGIMLAIMSKGPWFAIDSTSREFRDWFEGLEDTTFYPLSDNAFNGPDSFRPTGVACNVITIVKPE